MALAAVFTVSVLGHENAGTAAFSAAFIAQASNLAVVVDTVVLQDGLGNLLALVLDLLGSGVGLLLLLLGTTAQAKDQVKGGFLLNVVVGQGTAVFKLLSGED